jgi:hypothetical protein
MADLLCFLIIGVKHLEIESINPMKIVRNFRLCAQGWYLPLDWVIFFSGKQWFEMG